MFAPSSVPARRPGTSTRPVIAVSEMSKRVRGTTLYRGVSFEIPEGSFTVITGSHCTGKTMLLRMLSGFTTPDSGSVSIDPAYLSYGRTFPERFGITIDRPRFITRRTGLGNLRTLAAINAVVSEEHLATTMRRVGLDPEDPRRVRDFTPAMIQQLALAQALMEDPRVLILDEPFAELNPENREGVVRILRDLHAAGVTIVVATQSLIHVQELVTQHLIIRDETVETY